MVFVVLMLFVLISMGEESKERDKETNKLLKQEYNQSNQQLLEILHYITNHETNRANQTDREIRLHENRTMQRGMAIVESLINNTSQLIDRINKLQENNTRELKQELARVLLWLSAENADTEEDIDCMKYQQLIPEPRRVPCKDNIINNGSHINIDNKTIITNPYPNLTSSTLDLKYIYNYTDHTLNFTE